MYRPATAGAPEAKDDGTQGASTAMSQEPEHKPSEFRDARQAYSGFLRERREDLDVVFTHGNGNPKVSMIEVERLGK